jgi:hypothetical protein
MSHVLVEHIRKAKTKKQKYMGSVCSDDEMFIVFCFMSMLVLMLAHVV